jgi:cation diffusion facilitator CzcD-associated flavoprotein CzcO
MSAAAPSNEARDFDAVIIGAGISGMYQLYRLRELGMSVKVFEAGTGVGGTWYWNRYPGARFDSESYSYGYSFSEELLKEWDWSEHFAAQPETLRYLNFVADKFDLRRDIQFETRVESARYDEASNLWVITTEAGEQVRAHFLITAVGVLSEPYFPDIPGLDSFEGQCWHTGLWPHEPVDFSDKRVGVIGTGATAVQLITEVSKDVGHLTVFQRTPNYCVPLRNSRIDAETQREIKAKYPEIFAKCRETFGSFLHGFDERSALDVSAEEREAFYEELWSKPGFALWLGNFQDIFTSREANDTLSEFVRKKIRERIDDPAVAAKLVPTDHGFGTRRVPLESGYYEAYNRDNVLLVDVKESPIERITPKGVKTRDGEYELDILILATGFDAVTGAFNRIDIRGEAGQSLKDKWSDGPRTYLGLQSAGFPNLFTLVGPHNGGTFCNIPRCIEQNVEWVTECIRYMREGDFTRIEADPAAEDAWTEHVQDVVADTLIPETDSWFMGANVPGKKRTFLMYAGGAPTYRQKCEDVVAKGYEGFVLARGD